MDCVQTKGIRVWNRIYEHIGRAGMVDLRATYSRIVDIVLDLSCNCGFEIRNLCNEGEKTIQLCGLSRSNCMAIHLVNLK